MTFMCLCILTISPIRTILSRRHYTHILRNLDRFQEILVIFTEMRTHRDKWAIRLHSKNFWAMLHQKKSTDLLATKIRTMLHHILVLISELFTILWCNSSLNMVQLRTSFCSQQISASFWCNIGQKFLECSWTKEWQFLRQKFFFPT